MKPRKFGILIILSLLTSPFVNGESTNFYVKGILSEKGRKSEDFDFLIDNQKQNRSLILDMGSERLRKAFVKLFLESGLGRETDGRTTFNAREAYLLSNAALLAYSSVVIETLATTTLQASDLIAERAFATPEEIELAKHAATKFFFPMSELEHARLAISRIAQDIGLEAASASITAENKKLIKQVIDFTTSPVPVKAKPEVKLSWYTWTINGLSSGWHYGQETYSSIHETVSLIKSMRKNPELIKDWAYKHRFELASGASAAATMAYLTGNKVRLSPKLRWSLIAASSIAISIYPITPEVLLYPFTAKKVPPKIVKVPEISVILKNQNLEPSEAGRKAWLAAELINATFLHFDENLEKQLKSSFDKVMPWVEKSASRDASLIKTNQAKTNTILAKSVVTARNSSLTSNVYYKQMHDLMTYLANGLEKGLKAEGEHTSVKVEDENNYSDDDASDDGLSYY